VLPIAPPVADPHLRARDILSRVAGDRGRVYGWLAMGFYAPDATLIDALSSGRLAKEIESAIAWLGEDQQRLHSGLADLQACATTSLADLESAYAQLFDTGLDRVPPRESAYRWRDASTLLEATDAVVASLQQQYEQFNAVPTGSQADHVAVELEFLTLLCKREAASWASNAHATARLLRRQERVFLDDHLGRWLAEFCWRVRERAPGSFYAALAALSDAWLRLEHGPGYLPVLTKSW